MFILLIIAAYLLGSVPASYLAARWSHGIDIRQYGTGNVGVSNLWQLTSKPLAITVLLFDLGKGMVMVWATQQAGLGIAEQAVVGLAAIAGHSWPVFLRFSGGRGVLTLLGVSLILPAINSLIPWGVIFGLAFAASGWLFMHRIPLGVGIGIALQPLVYWAFGQPLPLILGFLAMFLIVVIRRLTAPKGPLTATVPKRELLINRLLFDRDIRDREAWIRQKLPENIPKKEGKGKVSRGK